MIDKIVKNYTLKQATMFCDQTASQLREAITEGKLNATKVTVNSGLRVTLPDLLKYCERAKVKVFKEIIFKESL